MKLKNINKKSSLNDFVEYLSDNGENLLSRKKPSLNRRKFADDAADCSDDDDEEDDDEEDEYDLDDDFIASENEEQDGKKTQTTEVLLFDFANYFIDNNDEDDAAAEEEAPHLGASLKQHTAAAATQKRKPGRPRKVAATAADGSSAPPTTNAVSTSPRPRGRPRKSPASAQEAAATVSSAASALLALGGEEPEPPADHLAPSPGERLPGHSCYPMNNFSLTVSKTKGDVDSSLLEATHQWIETHCVKGGVATEVGSRAYRLHLQGAFTIRYPKDKIHVDKLCKFYKDIVIKPRKGYKIMIKPLVGAQSMVAMIGYITKDQGRPHYQLRVHNVTVQDINKGRQEHNAMLANFEENKKVVTLRSVFIDAFRFIKRCMDPCIVPLDMCLTYMLQSGEYVLSPDFITSFRKLDAGECSVYWDLIHHPEECTLDDVRALVFDSRSYNKNLRKRYFSVPASLLDKPSVYEDSYEEPLPTTTVDLLVNSEAAIVSPDGHSKRSKVANMVDLIREANVTQDREPHYPEDDIVTFSESRTGNVIVPTESLLPKDLVCPDKLAEMLNLVRKIRDKRLGHVAYITGGDSDDESTNSSPYATSARNNYRFFCAEFQEENAQRMLQQEADENFELNFSTSNRRSKRSNPFESDEE